MLLHVPLLARPNQLAWPGVMREEYCGEYVSADGDSYFNKKEWEEMWLT